MLGEHFEKNKCAEGMEAGGCREYRKLFTETKDPGSRAGKVGCHQDKAGQRVSHAAEFGPAFYV